MNQRSPFKAATAVPGCRSTPIRPTAIALAAHLLLMTVAHAQIVSTSGALVGDKAANGTPIVNIAPPSSAGVSRNQYSAFNTDTKGAILNNRASSGASVLAGGNINGNPQLGATPAKVILNQVSGSTKSVINGKLEVAGTTAEVIVANPSGIDCTGCGFINTGRATLVTGTPLFASTGAVRSFDIAAPVSTINVSGLDASGAVLNLLAGQIKLKNGLVKGDVVNVIAGPNNIANTQYLTATPLVREETSSDDFHISVLPLSQVQAGKIFILNSSPNFEARVNLYNPIHINGTLQADDQIFVASASGLSFGKTAKLTTLPTGLVSLYAGQMETEPGFYASGISIYANATIYTGSLNLSLGNDWASSSLRGNVTLAKDLTIQGGSYQSLSLGGVWNIAGNVYIDIEPRDLASNNYMDDSSIHAISEDPTTPSIFNANIHGDLNIRAGSLFFGSYGANSGTYPSGVTYDYKSFMINMNVGGNTYIDAKHDITLGCTLNCSGIDATINTAGDLVIQSNNTAINQNTNLSGKDIFILGSESLGIQQSKLTAVQDIFISGKPNSAAAQKDIITGGALEAGRDITVVTSGNLGFGAIKTRSIEYLPPSCGSSWYSICMALNGGSITTDTFDTTSIKAGGNVVLQANNGIINLDGTNISADGSVVVAGQSVGLFGPVNTKVTHTNSSGTTTIISDQTLVVGQIQAKGDISVLATGNPDGITEDEKKGDLFLTGANISSQDGHVALTAAHDLDVANDVTVDTYYSRYYNKKRRLFYSKTTERVISTVDQTIEPSEVAGQTISMASGNDLTVLASLVQATGSIGLHADKNLNIISTGEVDTEFSYFKTKKSGIFGTGGFGLTVGSRSLTQTSNASTTTQTGSAVSSLLGDINLSSGEQYTQLSSELIAPTGNISINAKEVVVGTNNNTYGIIDSIRETQSGVTLSIGHPVLDSYQGIKNMEKAKQRTSSGHTQALAMLTSAMSLHTAFDSLTKTIDFSDASKLALRKDALNQFTASLTVGRVDSQFWSQSYWSLPQESSIFAGGNVAINATGEATQEQGKITISGSAISAGGSLSLTANDSLNLLASKGEKRDQTQTKASSAAFGVQLDASGFSAIASMSRTRGFTNGYGITYYPVLLTAGISDVTGTLSFTSGTDTNIKGATLSGLEVVGRVGTSGVGNLTMLSPQDSQDYYGEKTSWGANVKIGITDPTSSSLGFNLSQLDLMAKYQNAKEQTAIRAGRGGFNIEVNGDTVLTGAAIATETLPGKSYLYTDTLMLNDVQNYEYVAGKANSIGLNLDKNLNTNGSSYGFAEIDRSSFSTTKAAIAPSDILIYQTLKQAAKLDAAGKSAVSTYDQYIAKLTTDLLNYQTMLNHCSTGPYAVGSDGQTTCIKNYTQKIQTTTNGLNHYKLLRSIEVTDEYLFGGMNLDVNKAHKPLTPTFDARQATDDLELGASVMAAFTRSGYKKIGDYATTQLKEAEKLRQEAVKPDGTVVDAAKKARSDEIISLWGPSGTARAAAHALVGGIALGTSGLIASGTNVLTDDLLTQALSKLPASITGNASVMNALNVMGRVVIGSAIGGTNGAVATFNADANNRQLHPTEADWIKRNANRFAKIRFGTTSPTAEEEKNALILLATVAESDMQTCTVGYSCALSLPGEQQARDFLSQLKIEYYQKFNTLNLGGGQQFFYATDKQKDDTSLNAGLANSSVTSLIIRNLTTTSALANNPDGQPGRDWLTGLPLDEKGRYTKYITVGSGQVGVPGQTFALKFYPCSTVECNQNNVSLDYSDPETSRFISAGNDQVLNLLEGAITLAPGIAPYKWVNQAATVAGVAIPMARAIAKDPTLRNMSTTAGGVAFSTMASPYLQTVYRLPQPVADAIVMTISLNGGFDRFAKALSSEIDRGQ